MTYSAVQIKNTSTKKTFAPGPRGNWMMGNLKAYINDPVKMLMDLRNDFGDVVRNRLGPFLTHALAHPDMIEHVLVHNHRNYCRGKFYDHFKPIFGNGILTTDGDFWRQHRRVMQPAFHKTHVDNGMAIAGRQAEALLKRWQLNAGNEPVDVIPDMMELSLGALGEMMFKTDISRYHGQVGPHVRHAIRCMMPQGNLNDFLPRSWPTPFNIATRRARAGIDQVIDKVIDDHRANYSENNEVDTSDIIALLLSARAADGKSLSDTEIHDEVATVFLAGHETTGAGMSWMLYALAQHPHVTRALREELDSVLGGRAPLADDLPRLPYLEAFMHETLRVYPPIWTYTRDLIDDDEIGGFHIRGGSSIFVSPYVVHRHPDFWSNPEAFDPENFAPHAREPHKFAFIPFGGGMRKCVGYQIAMVMMRALAAIVVQHFDLILKPGHEVKRGALVSLRPTNGMPLIIRPRQRKSIGKSVSASSDAFVNVPSGAGQCPFMQEANKLEEPKSLEAEQTPKPARTPILLEAKAEGITGRIMMRPQERPMPMERRVAISGKRVLLVNGTSLMRERLETALAREFVLAKTLDGPIDTLEVTAQKLHEKVGGFDGIIDLGAIGSEDWQIPMRHTLAALKSVYADWAQEADSDRLLYLCVTAMDGALAMSGAPFQNGIGGLWAGLAKTLPQEMPNCNVRVLDLATDEIDQIAAHVCNELWRDTAIEIGYKSGIRFCLQPILAPLPTRPPMFTAEEGDVILFSGGMRGIGLVCAEAMAKMTGAEIVVTGRESLGENEDWAQLDDEAFKAWARSELINAASKGETVIAARRRTEALAKRRTAQHQLERLQASGVKISYRICDVTDPQAVRVLCQSLEDRLVMIVHNAGIDRPVRLPGKSVDDFLSVVRVKIEGFRNLMEASHSAKRLKRVLTFGSLTGRWGGMTGEIDYSAANEGLSRLTLQARRPGVVFRHLVWPTWEQIGMITNFDVTKRYVTPMPIADGVRYFLAETGITESGEAVFMGAVGGAVTPIQILGYQPLETLAGAQTLLTRRLHVGRPIMFQPYHRLSTHYDIDARRFDIAATRSFGQSGLLLAALLVEHALQVANWVLPEKSVNLVLVGAENITIDIGACLQMGIDRVVTVKTDAVGKLNAEEWHVEVTVALGGKQLLCLTAIFSEHKGAEQARPPIGKITQLQSLNPDDFWTEPLSPHFILPLGHFMTILAKFSGSSSMTLPSLRLGDGDSSNAEPCLIDHEEKSYAFDRSGQHIITVDLPL